MKMRTRVDTASRVRHRSPIVVSESTVFDAALGRMRWLFDEFDGRVVVSSSGGKDSTVVMELAARVAREKGCLPLQVWWLDQECEFAATVDYQRRVAYERDDIDFHWYQIPFRLENATDLKEQFLHVWGEGEEWVREKEPSRAEGGVAITENTYGEDHWYRLLASISTTDFADHVLVDGIRMEESPGRRLVCISNPQYKWATWSVTDEHPQNPTKWVYRFHPIFDWTFRDVWVAIESQGWAYNAHYDHLHQWGVPSRNMRVSNYHHDQALKSLWYLQEIEPETWEAATRRLHGINTYGHLREDQIPKKVPYMFDGWVDYMHHLIDNLIPEEDGRENFRRQYRTLCEAFPHYGPEWLAEKMMRPIITGDYWGTNVKNYLVAWRTWERQNGRIEGWGHHVDNFRPFEQVTP